jgi:hypothetical protein
MDRRSPSSLDYETLLHELALRNWRRSVLERDFPRALANAEQLSRSQDRFWRWQGFMDLAVSHLCLGRCERAREALRDAKECFRGVSRLRAPSIEMEASLWLQTGRPRQALQAVRNASGETPLLAYLGALAHARLGDLDSAAAAARDLEQSESPLARALAAHVETEIHSESGIAVLRERSAGLSENEPSSPAILVRFALGSSLLLRSEIAAALTVFEDLLRFEEAALHWPVPYVRSLYYRGWIRSRRGDAAGAAADGERFLSYWNDGDIDRERVEEARQWVKA